MNTNHMTYLQEIFPTFHPSVIQNIVMSTDNIDEATAILVQMNILANTESDFGNQFDTFDRVQSPRRYENSEESNLTRLSGYSRDRYGRGSPSTPDTRLRSRGTSETLKKVERTRSEREKKERLYKQQREEKERKLKQERDNQMRERERYQNNPSRSMLNNFRSRDDRKERENNRYEGIGFGTRYYSPFANSNRTPEKIHSRNIESFDVRSATVQSQDYDNYGSRYRRTSHDRGDRSETEYQYQSVRGHQDSEERIEDKFSEEDIYHLISEQDEHIAKILQEKEDDIQTQHKIQHLTEHEERSVEIGQQDEALAKILQEQETINSNYETQDLHNQDEEFARILQEQETINSHNETQDEEFARILQEQETINSHNETQDEEFARMLQEQENREIENRLTVDNSRFTTRDEPDDFQIAMRLQAEEDMRVAREIEESENSRNVYDTGMDYPQSIPPPMSFGTASTWPAHNPPSIDTMVPSVNSMDIQNMDLDDYESVLALGEALGDVNVGLSEEDIARMPDFGYTESMNYDPCSICLGKFKNEERLRRLTCLHSYHTACIDQWLNQSKKCPLCNNDITL